MAADVDAILARVAGVAPAAGAAPASDVDAILARFAPAAAPVASPTGLGAAELAGVGQVAGEDPGLLSAVGHGVARGLTLDWGDELEAGLRSLRPGGKYRDELTKVRDRYARNAEAHPIGEGLGNVIGSVLTGVGTAGIGAAARLGSAGAKGAAALAGIEGAVAGAGASEKTDLAGIAGDAAKSGALGAGLGAVIGKALGSYVDAAPARADRALMSDLFDQSTPTTRKKAADAVKGGVDIPGVARETGLDRVARDPEALADAVGAAQRTAGKRIGETYDGLDAAGPGVASAKVFDSLEELRKGLSGPSAAPMRDRLAKYVEDVKAEWGDLDSIPLKRLNKEIGELEAQGFASTELTPKAAAKLKRATAAALEGRLQERLAEIGGEEIANLPALNKQYRALLNIDKAAKERARREPFSKTGLRDIARETAGSSAPLALGILGAGGDLLSGGALYAATKAGQAAGKSANRAATESLAKLMRDAQRGVPGKQEALDAIRAGVPIATVRGILSLSGYLPDWANDLSGAE